MQKLILKLAARLLQEYGESLSDNICNSPSDEIKEIINEFEEGEFDKIIHEWNGGVCEDVKDYDWVISKAISDELTKMANKINPDEYYKAKQIVLSHENGSQELCRIRIENFRKELQEYFDNNLIDNAFKLKEFKLLSYGSNYGEIVPINPCMEEIYEGGNNEDIDNICKKYGLAFSFVYWVYHK